MPDHARERWLKKLRGCLADGSFVKLTLSRPRRPGGLRNVYGRFVDLKAGRMLQLTLRHPTRDETRNIAPGEGPSQIGSLLSDVFEEGHLFTTTGDFKLKAGPDGEGTMKGARPTFSALLPTTHDRPKQRALGPTDFLVKLGVTDAEGFARPGMADKLRQVERFVEILGHLVEASPLRDAATVTACDMGAGKGYLTFAAHEFFRRRGALTRMTGVEAREDLVAHGNTVAAEVAAEGLSFTAGQIGSFPLPEQLDVLIALHACDTATDDALAAGIAAGARLLVVSPCCHKEIRRQIAAPASFQGILRHGILAERQAELVTDGLRALALEACGYETKVFEFISSEHTGKNIMIAGIKRPLTPGAPEPTRDFRTMHDLMDAFQIRQFHLAQALMAQSSDK